MSTSAEPSGKAIYLKPISKAASVVSSLNARALPTSLNPHFAKAHQTTVMALMPKSPPVAMLPTSLCPTFAQQPLVVGGGVKKRRADDVVVSRSGLNWMGVTSAMVANRPTHEKDI